MPLERRSLFLWGACLLLAAVLLELGCLLLLNKGVLVYTLDDAYIHMALAENLGKGHYGVNSMEFSAPSSSILWPFLLAPFSSVESFPLLLNAASALAALYVFFRVLDSSFSIGTERNRRMILFLLPFLACVTNLIGLVFTGMEHTLQVLAVAVVAYGLIIEAQTNRAASWLGAAIVLAPLIRYENMAVSGAALVCLFLRGHGRQAVVAAVLLLSLMGGFSLFLMHLGLGPLPTSIVDKSAVMTRNGWMETAAENFKVNMSTVSGQLLACVAAGLAAYSFRRKDARTGPLAAAAILAIGLHLVAGKGGWYNRYENYIWAFSLAVACFLWGGHAGTPGEGQKRLWNAFRIAGAVCVVFLPAVPNLLKLFSLPIASNNIYEQQYQMHRFAVEYYHKPVAVNDLGYVSYKNSAYVLDLWGLASLQALRLRNSSPHSRWMDTLAGSKGVECAMIYEDWFKGVPDNWTKMGNLRLGKKKITPARSEVVFYALSEEASREILPRLREFVKTLPEGATFSFANEKSVQPSQ